MNPVFSSMADLRRAGGWVIDTSVAVCLQTAGWTEDFLGMCQCPSNRRQIAIAPRAFLDGENELDSEFSEQLDAASLELWRLADHSVPGGISSVLGNSELVEVQKIIRASRQGGGRAISRADAQGVYIAEQRNFALLTGDSRQAQVAQARNVTVIHKATVLEMMTYDAGLSIPSLCDGLGRLIANSSRNDPCALSADRRDQLHAIYRRQCPGDHIAT